jgi:hypothetical protein
MTELEKQLLSALEQLQQDYSKRLDEWENAFAEWRTMSGLMQRENAALSERVTGLSRQVQSLSEQLRRLSKAELCRGTPGAGARRSTRKRWSWNDRSDSGRTTVRHLNLCAGKASLLLAHRFSSRMLEREAAILLFTLHQILMLIVMAELSIPVALLISFWLFQLPR